MSAIWGIIGRNANPTNGLFDGMTDCMKKYRIDRIDHIQHENAFFACGHAYITKEAQGDISPVFDEETGVLFTADAFLTNRTDLIEAIKKEKGISDNYETMGDAFLCFTAFKTFGDSFIDHLRGAFSIALYDIKAHSLSLYTDHLAKRYLAYHIDGDFICFASTYGPVKSCMKGRLKPNKRCICEFYQSYSPKSFKSDDITVYDGIYHVNCSEVVRIDVKTGARTKKKYYEFGKQRQSYNKVSDEAFKDLFINRYRKAVKGLLRSAGETGVMLSGGLDSSSVAALAAEELAAEGKNLYSYTAIPASGYEFINNKRITQNEKPHVEAQKELHPNLVTNYITGDDGCVFTRLEKNTEMLECPVKAGNIDNIIRMFQAADEDHCKILTGGANGNATVSFGSIMTIMSYYFAHLRPFSAYKSLASFCGEHHISRKQVFAVYVRALVRSLNSIFTYRLSTFIKEEYCKKYHLERIGRKSQYESGTEAFSTRKQRRNFITSQYYAQHEGLYYTYMSLIYGVQYADPTEDVDLMEFCYNIPIKYQVKGGVDRRTVRGYMKDMLPECVTSKEVGRGMQAADVAFRVNRDWDEVKTIITDSLTVPELKEYADSDKIDGLLEKTGSYNGNMQFADIVETYAACSLGLFLKKEIR